MKGCEDVVHEPLEHSRGGLQSEWHAGELVSFPPALERCEVPPLHWYPYAEERILQVHTAEPPCTTDGMPQVLKAR